MWTLSVPAGVKARGVSILIGALALTASSLGGCAPAPHAEDELLEVARSLFGVLEPVAREELDAPEVVLGRELFWDERLSADGRTSCASCHTRENWGSDERPRSVNARGRLTPRQSLTVLNAMRQSSLRWVGDHTDGAEQATALVTAVMGLADTEDIVALLAEHGYEDAFRKAFPDHLEPLSPENYGRALRAYQSTLVTPGRFDDYLRGSTDALTLEEREGLELFVSTGCAGCHAGDLLGGETFQRFGVVEDYWEATGSEEVDVGRYAVSGQEEDRYVFRTPMLRNVARTGPYFHDGSVTTLERAVRIMAEVQLGRGLPPDDVARIVAFLGSLSGELPENYGPPR